MDRRGFLGLVGLGVLGMIPSTLSYDAQLADIKRRVTDLESSPDLYGSIITGSVFRAGSDERGITIKGLDGNYGDGSSISFLSPDGSRFDMFKDHNYTQLRSYSADESESSAVFIDVDSIHIETSSGDQWANIRALAYQGTIQLGSSDLIFLSAPTLSAQFDDSLSMQFGDGTVYIDVSDDNVTLWTNDMNVWAEGNIYLSAGSDAANSVYLINIPQITGQTANLYMDPSTGKISRI